MEEIISQEFHHITFFQEHLQILERGLGTSIPVISRHIMIHHQDDLLAHTPFTGPEWVRIAVVLTLACQLCRPFFPEFFIIDHLIPFQATSLDIGSVRHTLKMNHLGQWLIYHPVSGFSHLKGQIGIFTVCRGKSGIKSADLLPQIIRQQDRRTGNVIHILHIVIFRLIRVIQTAIVPAGTIAPDDAASLL